jgi:hypothetical protein
MAANANSTTASAIATALAMQAGTVAKTKTKTIQNLADVLARLMQEIHGGSWRACVDHGPNTSLVLIRPNNETAIAKPTLGKVA